MHGRVAGVIVRTQPKASARSCGQRDCGQYVCGTEVEGLWLHLAPSRRLTDNADTDSEEQVDQWVCLKDKGGKVLLEAVHASNVGSLASSRAPVENDPQAEKFDRPFEPRLQAPGHQAPSAVSEEGDECETLDMKTFEEKDEHCSESVEEPVELFVGCACVLQALAESSKNGQACVVCKLPRDDGRCVVQMSGTQSKLSVKPANLRPLKRPNESEQSYCARTLGLTLNTLGLGGGSDVAACLQSVGPAEILAAALRAAQRDLSDAPDVLIESQEAYDKLKSNLASGDGHDGLTPSQPFPPHTLVENGLLGTRAAHAAANAASQQSIKTLEAGIAALRQVLSDEHRRLAREAGLAWPLPAAGKFPSEGSDALRLRLTLVRALLRSRQEEQAAQEAEACVRRHPHGAAGLLWAGRCLLRIGRREQGKKYLSMAEHAGRSSGADGAWGVQGATMRLQALAKVERCKLAAEDAYAYGDFQTAAARYGEALVHSPTDDKWGRAMLHAARAACHRRARDFRQAVDDCDAALALFPNYARALFRRAACLIEAGRPSEAIKSLEGLLKIDRSWPNLSDWLVRAHALAKRLESSTFKASWKKSRRSTEDAGAPEVGSLGSDLYAVLGVSADATDQQLKRAYRLMSLKYHPDKQGGSTRDFQRIATAYETLSDPAKRHAYNEGADLKKKDDDDSDESERDEKSLREEVERTLGSSNASCRSMLQLEV